MKNFETIEIEKNASYKIVKLLENNIIGTPGQGMLYKLLNVKNKINRLINPWFVSIYLHNKVVGTCCFDERFIHNRGQSNKAFYVRYFSFLDQFRRKNVKVRAKKSNSIIKSEVNQLLSGKGLVTEPRSKFLFYAYVDLHNERSRVLCEEFGFEKIREFKALLFSRLIPRRDNRVTKLSDISQVRDLLAQFYQNYSLVDLDMLEVDKFFVIKNESDEVVAGVQCNLEHWNILDIPGITGKFILKVIPKIPLLNRYFNQDYYFLSFDSIFVKDGYEKDLISLFNHLLFISGIKVASICLDIESELYLKMKNFNLGFMQKLQNNMIHQVIVKPVNYTECEKKQLSQSPAFISSFDIT